MLSLCLSFKLIILITCRIFFTCLSYFYCSVFHIKLMRPIFPFFLTFFFFCFLLTQCTQSTKDVLERAVHSFNFHDLCPPGTPKTTPLGLEVSNMAAPSPEPSASVGCSRQDTLHSVAAPCPAFSRSSKRDSLHSINPAFRLASPSPSLSRATLILGDAPDVGVIPLS